MITDKDIISIFSWFETRDDKRDDLAEMFDNEIEVVFNDETVIGIDHARKHFRKMNYAIESIFLNEYGFMIKACDIDETYFIEISSSEKIEKITVHTVHSANFIQIPRRLIKELSNDFDLGRKIRSKC